MLHSLLAAVAVAGSMTWGLVVHPGQLFHPPVATSTPPVMASSTDDGIYPHPGLEHQPMQVPITRFSTTTLATTTPPVMGTSTRDHTEPIAPRGGLQGQADTSTGFNTVGGGSGSASGWQRFFSWF